MVANSCWYVYIAIMPLPANIACNVNNKPKVVQLLHNLNIDEPDYLFGFLEKLFDKKLKEEIWLLCLNSRQGLIAILQLAIGEFGSASFSLVDIFLTVSLTGASSVIMAHNHTTGSPLPSDNDIHVTGYLDLICGTLGVSLEDHVIISGNRYFSFKFNGFLK